MKNKIYLSNFFNMIGFYSDKSKKKDKKIENYFTFYKG